MVNNKDTSSVNANGRCCKVYSFHQTMYNYNFSIPFWFWIAPVALRHYLKPKSISVVFNCFLPSDQLWIQNNKNNINNVNNKNIDHLHFDITYGVSAFSWWKVRKVCILRSHRSYISYIGHICLEIVFNTLKMDIRALDELFKLFQKNQATLERGGNIWVTILMIH